MQCSPISEMALLFGKVRTICTFAFLVGQPIGPVFEEPIDCLETSVRNYHSALRNVSKYRRSLDVTCFIISLFNAQYVSDVNTSSLRSLRLIC